jgi:hypothetical protein
MIASRSIYVPLLSITLVACSDDAASDPVRGACPAEHAETTEDGVATTACTSLFAEAPYIHLPADTADTVYVGFVDGMLMSRTASYPMTDLSLRDPEAATGLHYAYYVYRAKVSNGKISGLTRVIRVDDRAIASLLAGRTFEGKVSLRNPGDLDRPFAFDNIIAPIRVELAAEAEPAEYDRVGGYPRFGVRGHIVNASTAVSSDDASCLPALSSLGDANPLFGAGSDEILVLRHPGMHTAFQDVFTFEWPAGVTLTNNMGAGLFLPTIVLAKDEALAFSDANSVPHGTPWSGPSVQMAVVSGGGEACAP